MTLPWWWTFTLPLLHSSGCRHVGRELAFDPVLILKLFMFLALVVEPVEVEKHYTLNQK